MSGIPQFNTPAIDIRTGQWNRQWILFLSDMWDRLGGPQGQSTNDLTADLPEDAGIEELKAEVYRNRDIAASAPQYLPPDPVVDTHGRIESLEAAVAQMAAEIQSIKQGQQL